MVEATDIANDTPWTDGDTTAGHFAAGNTAFTGKIDAWYGESSVYVEGTAGYKATCLGMKGREVCEKFRCKLHKQRICFLIEDMNYIIAKGLLIPFLGTAFGSALVFFMKKELDIRIQKILSGFAAGVMVAASVWSLLIPSMEMSADRGKLAFIPAAVGFCVGMIFLLILDKTVPHMHLDETEEGPKSKLQKTTMMVLAVTLHNIPEGMAVGILYAGWASGSAQITEAGALSLALGIAIQNFPEGAIISMPLHARGISKAKSCWYGVLSGVVEPVAGLITILLASLVMPVLPYFLSFAAGAMIYVVVEELVPEMAEGKHSDWGTIAFMLGFTLMMVLDVALG